MKCRRLLEWNTQNPLWQRKNWNHRLKLTNLKRVQRSQKRPPSWPQRGQLEPEQRADPPKSGRKPLHKHRDLREVSTNNSSHLAIICPISNLWLNINFHTTLLIVYMLICKILQWSSHVAGCMSTCLPASVTVKVSGHQPSLWPLTHSRQSIYAGNHTLLSVSRVQML